MCEYIPWIRLAVQQLAEQNDSFDMLQVRDRTREIAGPTVDVRFPPCKFEALTFFERGGIPGFILTIKTIEMETDMLLLDEEGHHTREAHSDGSLICETVKRSVFNFVKVTAVVYEELTSLTPAIVANASNN